LPSTPDLACDAGHLGGEAVELVDHRVDGVLELEELALDVAEIFLLRSPLATAWSPRRCSAPAREVAGHQVDVVGEVLPDAADLDRHGRRLAELAFGADLTLRRG
jgi:hypothetical protein